MLLNNIEMDLHNLDLLTTDASSSSESVLSPHTAQSSRSSEVHVPDIIIPSSSGPSGGIGSFNLPGDQDLGIGAEEMDQG